MYELADISIVSKRVQKHPEGLAFSATPRSETDSQPTRTMKESMESLPGVILRSANGPRDFGVSIRGSGVKTTGVVRDLKFYEDGIGQTQSDGFSRLDMHDPWFMQSVEVTRGAAVVALRQRRAGRHDPFQDAARRRHQRARNVFERRLLRVSKIRGRRSAGNTAMWTWRSSPARWRKTATSGAATTTRKRSI
ncbi:MAG: Plug domain-containing protein [Microthrixaceae bacterium]